MRQMCILYLSISIALLRSVPDHSNVRVFSLQATSSAQNPYGTARAGFRDIGYQWILYAGMDITTSPSHVYPLAQNIVHSLIFSAIRQRSNFLVQCAPPPP